MALGVEIIPTEQKDSEEVKKGKQEKETWMEHGC